MSDLKMSDEQILYCLQNLAGYEPDDIDCDDVDIAVNDDQFASISIVRTAELGAELVSRLNEQLEDTNEMASQRGIDNTMLRLQVKQQQEQIKLLELSIKEAVAMIGEISCLQEESIILTLSARASKAATAKG